MAVSRVAWAFLLVPVLASLVATVLGYLRFVVLRRRLERRAAQLTAAQFDRMLTLEERDELRGLMKQLEDL